MKLKFFPFFFTTLFFTFLLKSESDLVSVNLNIQLNNTNHVKFKSIGNDQIIKGTFFGVIKNIEDVNFSDTNLECDFLGRSYKGRGFSCGFAIIEDLQGFCYISKKNKKDILTTSWSCNTTAGINGDAYCLGKLNIVQGTGNFAGITGYGKMNMPLAKSLNDEISIPMKLNLSLKYPLSLNKN